MCGIVGMLTSATLPEASVFDCMVGEIKHRGPDSQGTWRDDDNGVLLGSTRLAIRDLSAAGHQPMVSASGRYVIAFNGEVYNNGSLREGLAKHAPAAARVWRGESDTETLLAAIDAYGPELAIQETTGMFAFALWDRHERTLSLFRDRFGEKPLYYGLVGRDLVFSSEVKPLKCLPAFNMEIDRDALGLLLRHNCVPAPYSIYRGILKLRPAHSVVLTAADVERRVLPEPRPYWSAIDMAERHAASRIRFDTSGDAIDALETKLRAVVRGQMVSDVPLGAFLSGGIDSSAIVALMQSESLAMGSGPVRTFTIGFEDRSYDESGHARAVATHLRTEHTELRVTAQDVLGVIPNLPVIYDEPFADSSQVPTYLISALARRHVTVALSGDGGDELFGGYNRHLFGAGVHPWVRRIPKPVRHAMASGIRTLPPATWGRLLGSVTPALPPVFRLSQPGYRLHVAANVLGDMSPQGLHRNMITHWEPATAVIGGGAHEPILNGRWPDIESFSEQMMAMDAVTYLPSDILTKVDRAAMAVSLETRMPYLDHSLFEFAWTLPLDLKIRGGIGKWILREMLYRHVPRQLLERPKMGFSMPIDSWLRGPLREWAEALLDEGRLRREGYFHPKPIREKWDAHIKGTADWHFHLWDVLMFQAWLEASRQRLH